MLPETAPFPADQIVALNRIISGSSAEQRTWLSGFLAGYQAATTPQPAAAAPRLEMPTTDVSLEGAEQLMARVIRNGAVDISAIQAIEKDPRYALAYAGLADAHGLVAFFGLRPARQVMPVAKEAALKALELDDALAEAHVALGSIKKVYDWDWLGAQRE